VKVALITGAGRGIGHACAVRLAADGYRVVIADRAGAEAAAGEIGETAHPITVDLADAEQTVALAQRVLSDHGRCDVLVNNAGIGSVGTVLTTKAEELDRLYGVNVRGTMFMCQAFLPAMLAAGRGSIVNLASIGGVTGIRDRFAYCTTKFAVVGMTKCMAIDHATSGVRINCICPGRVETPWVKARLAEYPDPAKAYEQMKSTQAQNRMGTPKEIAAAALYLASDESAFMTGNELIIDGGWLAGK